MIVFCFYKVSKFELTVEPTIELTENDKVKNFFALFYGKTHCKHCRNEERASLVKCAGDVILVAAI